MSVYNPPPPGIVSTPDLTQVLTAGNDGGGLNMKDIGTVFDSTGIVPLIDFSGTPSADFISFDTTYGVTNMVSNVAIGSSNVYYGFPIFPLLVGVDYNGYAGADIQNTSTGSAAGTTLFISADNDNFLLQGHYGVYGILNSGWTANTSGVVQTVSVGSGGTGYTVGDVLTVSGGAGDLTVTVGTTGGGGDVTSVTILDNGTEYSISSGNATTGGTGTGCTIDITSLFDITIASANDVFTFASGGNYLIGTDGSLPNSHLKFFTGGLSDSNVRMIISDSGIQMFANLFDTANVLTLNFDSRSLYSTLGNAMMDWSQSIATGIGLNNGISSFSFTGNPVVISSESLQLFDGTGILSENWTLRELIESDGTTVSLNWDTLNLTGAWDLNGSPIVTAASNPWKDVIGVVSLTTGTDHVEIQTGIYDATNALAGDFNNRILVDAVGNTAIDYTGTYNSLAGISFDNLTFDDAAVFRGPIEDNNLAISIAPNTRQLYDHTGFVAVDWDRYLLQSNVSGSLFTIIDWSGGYNPNAVFSFIGVGNPNAGNIVLSSVISDTATQANSLDTNSRQFTDSSNFISGDWNARQLFLQGTLNPVLDWTGLYNSSASVSFDGTSAIFNSIILSTDLSVSLDTNARQLFSELSASPAIDWSGILNANAGISMVTTVGGILEAIFNLPIQDAGGDGNPSISTSDRILFSTAANGSAEMIDWTGTPNGSASISFDMFGEIVFGHAIFDTTGNESVDTNNRELLDSTNATSIIWELRTLRNGATLIVDWTNTYNGGALMSFSSGSAVFANAIMDSSLAVSLDTNNRLFIDTFSTTSGNWTLRTLNDSGGNESIHWDTRILSDASNTSIFTWDTSVSNFPEFLTSLFFSSGSTILDDALASSIDPNGRLLTDAGIVTSVDYGNRKLYRDITGTPSVFLDWEAEQFFTVTTAGAGGYGMSADFSLRQLIFEDVLASPIIMIDWNDAYNSAAALSFDPSQNVYVTQAVNSTIPQTTYTGSTSGTGIWSMPFQGASYKKFVINLQALIDAGGTITFPTAFSQTPYLYGDASATAVCTASTTTFTIAVSAGATGNVFCEGI